jgi:predicted GIY-YIG superfamily endonuclease
VSLDLDSSGVYLICFDRAYKHARHYLGWAKNIKQRISEHRNGQGARLLAVINEVGIEWEVVRVRKDADRSVESRFKHSHDRVSLCPICGEERRQKKLRQRRESRRANGHGNHPRID